MHSKNNCLYSWYLFIPLISMNHIINFYQTFRNESLQYGRAHAKKYIRQFLLLFLISIAASWIVQNVTPKAWVHNIMELLSKFLYVIVTAVLTVVTLKIYLDVAGWKWVNFNHFNLTTRAKRWVIAKWIWWYVIYSLIIIGWLILLVIPGLYFAIRLSLRQFYLVDKNMKIADALRASRDATKWHEWELIWVWLLCFAIVFLWAFALGIWLLRAIPTVKIAYTHMYKKISV